MTTRTLSARLAIPRRPGVPAVVIYHPKGTPPASVLSLFADNVPLVVWADRKHWRDTDLVIQSTPLTTARERFAARMNAPLCLLPEQSEYISGFIDGRRGEAARPGQYDYDMGYRHGERGAPHDVYLWCAYSGQEVMS